MPTKLPPIRRNASQSSSALAASSSGEKQQHHQQQSGSPSPSLPSPSPAPSQRVIARPRQRGGRSPSPTHASGDDSPAVASEKARLSRKEKAAKRQAEQLRAIHARREDGFRFNAFETTGVFSTFTTESLVLAERDRRSIEVAVARRRQHLDHERKARDLQRADELRRRRVEQQRIEQQHELRLAQERAEIERKAEAAARERRNRTAAVSLIEKRRQEIEAARQLSVRREEHRETRRAGKDPHLEQEQQRTAANRSPSPRDRTQPSSPSAVGATNAGDRANVSPLLAGSIGESAADAASAAAVAIRLVADSLQASPHSASSVTEDEGAAMALVAELLEQR